MDDDEWGVQNYTLKLLTRSRLFSIKNNRLVPRKKLNYETSFRRRWNLKIRATDNGDPPFSVSVGFTSLILDFCQGPGLQAENEVINAEEQVDIKVAPFRWFQKSQFEFWMKTRNHTG